MKLISILLFFFSNISFAQFAIISDRDGFVNIRKEAKTGNNISDQLNNGFVVYCFEPEKNWINIDYSKNNKDRNGYLYKDRVHYLSEFTKIPLIKETRSQVIFKKDGIDINIESKNFESNSAKLTFLKNDKSILKKINGKDFWGTDGGIPKRTYKNITLVIDNKTIELPKNAFDDLFEPNLFNTKINFDKKNNILYITSSNSDGAGGYEIVWIIEKGKYKERKIAFGF